MSIRTRSWEAEAPCREIGPDIFHPVGRGRELTEAIAAAKAICSICPFQPAYLADALDWEGTADRYSRDGIWGGLTGPERAALATQPAAAA
ncbi:WhiB family transcriptional regulator [Streptomyces sp. NPDC127069]|uniref:WhiB family transcriptional regulator n=1 Tax=Streptomyces sp. NPDC127069 TaxID=3347128 RepID=UPI0036628B68